MYRDKYGPHLAPLVQVTDRLWIDPDTVESVGIIGLKGGDGISGEKVEIRCKLQTVYTVTPPRGRTVETTAKRVIEAVNAYRLEQA
jgi:hypothetical protein